MTIIQRYAGMSALNCEIWIDTAFPTLEDSYSHPDHIYRAITVEAISAGAQQRRNFWGDAHTVGIKPCCERHA